MFIKLTSSPNSAVMYVALDKIHVITTTGPTSYHPTGQAAVWLDEYNEHYIITMESPEEILELISKERELIRRLSE